MVVTSCSFVCWSLYPNAKCHNKHLIATMVIQLKMLLLNENSYHCFWPVQQNLSTWIWVELKKNFEIIVFILIFHLHNFFQNLKSAFTFWQAFRWSLHKGFKWLDCVLWDGKNKNQQKWWGNMLIRSKEGYINGSRLEDFRCGRNDFFGEGGKEKLLCVFFSEYEMFCFMDCISQNLNLCFVRALDLSITDSMVCQVPWPFPDWHSWILSLSSNVSACHH